MNITITLKTDRDIYGNISVESAKMDMKIFKKKHKKIIKKLLNSMEVNINGRS